MSFLTYLIVEALTIEGVFLEWGKDRIFYLVFINSVLIILQMIESGSIDHRENISEWDKARVFYFYLFYLRCFNYFNKRMIVEALTIGRVI